MAINPNHFTGSCTVTLATTVPRHEDSCCEGVLNGHAMIIVQQNGTNIFGYYHILAPREEKGWSIQKLLGNTEGIVTTIEAEKGERMRGYKIVGCRKWFNVDVGRINAMVDDILLQMRRIREEEGYSVPYQKAGNKRWSIWGGNGGHNCMTWCLEKLAVAHLKIKSAATDSSMTPLKVTTSPTLTNVVNLTAAAIVIAPLVTIALNLLKKQ